MNKIFIVLLFILLGSSLIVLIDIKGSADNSFNIVYENNKNLAMPNLSTSTEIIDGLYRLYDTNGITIDYNVYNGIYTMNGTPTVTSLGSVFTIPLLQNGITYTISRIYISGSKTSYKSLYILSPTQFLLADTQIHNTFVAGNNQRHILISDVQPDKSFNNYQFKLQLEKGSQSTNYVVPKLIPIYKDNLSQAEKEQIGLGAFLGIPTIIRSVNNIIKPITDFFNGLISMFS